MERKIFLHFTDDPVKDIEVENGIHTHDEVVLSQQLLQCLLVSIFILSL